MKWAPKLGVAVALLAGVVAAVVLGCQAAQAGPLIVPAVPPPAFDTPMVTAAGFWHGYGAGWHARSWMRAAPPFGRWVWAPRPWVRGYRSWR